MQNGKECIVECTKTSLVMLYVQVTVHRDNLRINNQQDASGIQNLILSRNSACFEHLLCPSSKVIRCKRGNWYVSCRLCGRCLGESGWNFYEDSLLMFNYTRFPMCVINWDKSYRHGHRNHCAM
jgi:hypothetical protein